MNDDNLNYIVTPTYIDVSGTIKLATTIVPSVNMLYIPRSNGKRTWTQKDPTCAAFQSDFESLANKTALKLLRDNGIAHIQQYYHMSIVFKIKQSFWRRDTSNMLKAMEDSLAKVTGIDDRFCTHLDATKEKSLDDHEYIDIKIRVYLDEAYIKQQQESI